MKSLLHGIIIVFLIAAIAVVALQIPAELSNTENTKSSSTPTNIETNTSPSQNNSSPGSGNSSGGTTTAAQSTQMTANWAGYAATNGDYTYISSSWNVPQVSASDEMSSDATWIGIGGVNSQDLIQIGTQDIVAPGGQVQTSAFYETLPEESQTISSLSVNPGDSIYASLNEAAGGQWTLSITDNTSGQSYSTTVYYDSSNSSAEWIEEDPSDGYGFVPLDSFGSVAFSSASTVNNGTTEDLTTAGAVPIDMVNSADEVEASVSSINSNGSSFTVTRTSSPSVGGISQFNVNPWSFIRRGSGVGFSYSF